MGTDLADCPEWTAELAALVAASSAAAVPVTVFTLGTHDALAVPAGPGPRSGPATVAGPAGPAPRSGPARRSVRPTPG